MAFATSFWVHPVSFYRPLTFLWFLHWMNSSASLHMAKRLTTTLSRAQAPTRRANFNNNCELFSLLKGKVEVMEDIATVIIWYHIYWFFSPLNHCLGPDVKLVFTLLALIAVFNAPIPYLTFLQFSTCSVSVLLFQAFSLEHLHFDLSELGGLRVSSLLSLLEHLLSLCEGQRTWAPPRLLLHPTKYRDQEWAQNPDSSSETKSSYFPALGNVRPKVLCLRLLFSKKGIILFKGFETIGLVHVT